MAEKKNQNRSDCFSHSQLTEEACSGNRAGAGFFACAKEVRKLALSAAGSENFHLFESRRSLGERKKTRSATWLQALAWWCGRWDLNPHTEVPAPKTGASAIPPLPRI